MFDTATHRAVHAELLYLGLPVPDQLTLFFHPGAKTYTLLLEQQSPHQPVQRRQQWIHVWNYYQRLLTPPIVAAPQRNVNTGSTPARSLPGLGKLNGKTRVQLVVRVAGECDADQSTALQEFLHAQLQLSRPFFL